MDLLCTRLGVMAVVLAAVVMAMITQDGETNRMEGGSCWRFTLFSESPSSSEPGSLQIS